MSKKQREAGKRRKDVFSAEASTVVATVKEGVAQRTVYIGAMSSRSKAAAVARKLNQVIREAMFKPKNAGRRARSKGHSFEREVAKLLRPLFPEARRHLEYQDAEANGVDLVNTGPFRFQCKKLKKYAPITTIGEIQCDPLSGEIPVLVTAGDGQPPMAVLPFDDFLRLARARI